MSKVDPLKSITSGFNSTQQLNSNFEKITQAFNNTLSRDGSSPNTMSASLDMNSNRILNLPEPLSVGEPITRQYLENTYIPYIEGLDIAQTAEDAANAAASAELAHQYALQAQAAAGNNIISVKELGCICDGVTDDAPALQQALANGYRSFIIPAGATLALGSTLQLSGNTPSSFRYTGISFIGDEMLTSKLAFTNGDSSYQTDANMAVGIASYYSTVGTEQSGTAVVSFQNMTIAAPKRGCGVFLANAGDIMFRDVNFTTNSAVAAERAKYHVYGSACIEVSFERCRFSHAYVSLCHLSKNYLANRSTKAAIHFNDSWNWEKCMFNGDAYAAIIDSGSGSEAVRNIKECIFGTASRYYGYLGQGAINLNYEGNWDENGRRKVVIHNTTSHTLIPFDGLADIANVLDPATVYYDDFFSGGASFGCVIQGSQFYNGYRNLDLTGVFGSSLVQGNAYRMKSSYSGELVHLYVDSGNSGNILYLGDYNTDGAAPPTGIWYEVKDLAGSVKEISQTELSQTVSGSPYYSGMRMNTEPFGGNAVDAGTGGTRHHKVVTQLKLDSSRNGTFIPCVKLQGSVFSGPVKVRLNYGAGTGGSATGFQETVILAGFDSSRIWTVRDAKVITETTKNGTYYSMSQNPQISYGMIKNKNASTVDPCLYLAVTGGHDTSSMTLEVEIDAGFLVTDSGKTRTLRPKVTYTTLAQAAIEIAAEEALTTGNTVSMTTVPMYQSTFTWDPASLADGACEIKNNIALNGARVGDEISIVPPYSLQGIMCTGYVVSDDVVGAVLYNKTGGAINLANSTGWIARNKR